MKSFRVPILIAFAWISVSGVAAQKNNPYSSNPDPRMFMDTIAAKRSPSPTEIYKVGAGDVLFISLENANASGSYTVRSDGTIDYPLAGDDPSVKGMTTHEIEALLSSRVTLYCDPRITVRVKEYASHTIYISGLAALTGARALRREAMPLYAIKAEVGVDAPARKVIIRRSQTAEPEIYDFDDASTDDILVQPGSSLEFITNR